MFYVWHDFGAAGLLLCLASLLDFCLGDPQGWLHPVQVMGWGIRRYQAVVLSQFSSALARKLAGVVLGLGLMLVSAGLGAGAVVGAAMVAEELGLAIATVLLASCFAGRSLRRAADDVLQPLTQSIQPDLAQARHRLSQYVGRDTDHLSKAEVQRALFETVTENAVDGVLAPLFFAGVGGVMIPPLLASMVGSDLWLSSGHLPESWQERSWAAVLGWAGTVALALAYKAASTLDSMVGYRQEPYRDLGWFSARFEDGLTWLPCRLAVLSIALIAGVRGWANPLRVLQICRRDAGQDASPNSGWSESVYAAALGVQVGGDNTYQGVLRRKPKLGDDRQPITPERIRQSLSLTRMCFLLWLAIAVLILR